MLLAGVLGFQNLFLAVCLAVPVIVLVARRKWKLAVSRNEEIKRLLILASEESARAELEAAVEFGSSAVTVSSNQCAVCFFPTTTRCARCKAVRYCSGKCQIIHWRQGHKNNCHPPPSIPDVTDFGGATGLKVSQEEDSGDYTGRFARQEKSIDEHDECSAEVLYDKDDYSEIESPTVYKGISSASESCSTSFSGFSTSAANSDSSDDVSVNDSISLDESVISEGCISPDRDFDPIPAKLSSNDSDHSETLSPKFASLVNSVTFAAIDKWKESENFEEGDNFFQETSQLPNEIKIFCDVPIAEPCESSSDFWKSALESVDPQIEAYNDSGTSDTTVPSARKVSGGSSPSTPFSSAKISSIHLCTKGPVEKVTLYDDAFRDGVGNRKPIDRSFSYEKVDSTESQRRDFRSLNAESQSNGDKCRRIQQDVEMRDDKSTRHIVTSSCSNPSDDISLPFTKSKKPDYVYENSKKSHLTKSEDHGSLSSVNDVRLASGLKDPISTRSKSGDSDVSQDCASVSSQISNAQNPKNGFKSSMQRVAEQFRVSKLPKQHTAGLGGMGAGRYTDKGLFPYDSFVKLYAWSKEEMQPRGLINCGNSCYANAVLQCLIFTPPLTAYFLQGFHSKDCVKKEWCFTCELERLVMKVREGKSPISPIGIVSQLPNIGSQLGNGREEDAHEFLRYAIDAMQAVCLAEARIGASNSLEEETTLPGLTFGGYLRSKIKCMKCLGKSERHERMMDVTVEISGDIGSLEEALRKFTSTETLDGDNKYQCGRCKSYEKAKKKLTILEAPNVLTIALKRFQSGKFGKLTKPIKFPEILNMAPYMSGTSDKLAIYRLYGVIVHIDVMNAAFSGHYVAYVKNALNKWFKVDDSTVMPVDLEKVLSKGAYMLLYARCSPRAPKSIRNSIVTSDPKVKPASWIGGKSSVSKSKSKSKSATIPAGSNPPEGHDSLYSRDQPLQRIVEEDSSSDNRNSDEGSCSTRVSSVEDFSDFIFGEPGKGWTSSLRHSPLSDLDRSSSAVKDCPCMATEGFLPSDSTEYRNLTSSSRRKTDFQRVGSESVNDVKYNNIISTRRSSSSTRETEP